MRRKIFDIRVDTERDREIVFKVSVGRFVLSVRACSFFRIINDRERILINLQ